MGPMTIAGTASQLIDTIGAYAELGFDELIVPDFNLGRTAAERLEMLDRIRTEVLEQV
jgi:alkanesulfonate monooxygenase SsuD/methylene tetrahydromethanopterin reductase-like flavin-dependent oxidoreductase (luciferase family)